MPRYAVLLAGLAVLAGCSQPGAADSSADRTRVAEPDPPATGPAVSSDPARAWVEATYGDDDVLTYKSGKADLDYDGVDELFVYPAGPMRCGSGGCNLVVLQKSGAGWTKASELTVTQLPVGVLDSSTNGWRDLWVTVAGGGVPRATKKLMFDGKSYPANPTVAPAVAIANLGTVIIADGAPTRIR